MFRIGSATRAPGDKLTEVMADVWATIFGQTYATVTGVARIRALDKLVTILNNGKVTEDWNRNLMKEISEEEVATANKSLNRFKASGLDGLNNDCFKDCDEALTPALVTLFNRILKSKDCRSRFYKDSYFRYGQRRFRTPAGLPTHHALAHKFQDLRRGAGEQTPRPLVEDYWPHAARFCQDAAHGKVSDSAASSACSSL